MTYNPLLQCHVTKPEKAKLRDSVTDATRCAKDIFQAALEGDVECLRANLEQGVDINRMGQPTKTWGPRYEKSGLFYATALHYACSYNRELAVRFLLQRGARTDIRSASGLTCKEYARRRNYVNILVLLDRSGDSAASAADPYVGGGGGRQSDDGMYDDAGAAAMEGGE